MSLRSKLKKIKFIREMYYKFKQIKLERIRLKGKYTLINRRKNLNKVCYILAGYKSFLWEDVFTRINNFVTEDIDVCILSSGVYNKELELYAEKYNWSYMYTKVNNISLAQNLLIKEFSSAQYIYKLDEDIFVTDGYFTNLFKCYQEVFKNGEFIPGIVAPIITVNGFGHMEILKKYNLIEYYNNTYETAKYCAGNDRMIEYNPDVAKFMWGENEHLPQLDQINRDFQYDGNRFSTCPIRLSIGAILFERKFWESLKYFEVTSKRRVDLGVDETQICNYCIDHSRPIIICCNSVVGHLSFGSQNNEMKNYYQNNKDKFKIG